MVLPALFLLSAITMGYAVVLFESCLASSAYRREIEMHMLTPWPKSCWACWRVPGAALGRPGGARCAGPCLHGLGGGGVVLGRDPVLRGSAVLIGAEANRRNPARLFLAGCCSCWAVPSCASTAS